MNRFLVGFAAPFVVFVFAAGCSSLVDDYCARGYVEDHGTCVPRPEVDGGQVTVSPDARMPVGNFDPDPAPGPDAGPDAPVDDAGVDAAPDAGPACAEPLEVCYGACIDLQTHPDHCGSCTHSCASGICANGHCQGDPWGHIVAIGHDYTSYHAAQRRVLVNAVTLGASTNLAVTWWPGESRSMAHMTALTSGMASVGRAWHEVVFPSNYDFTGIDVIIVAPDTGDGDAAEQTGAMWAATFDAFLRTGGVIVVLDGANGTNHRFADGAQLFDVGAPVVVTGQPTAVVDGTDAIAEQLVAPYLAEATSVSWPGAPQPVVTTMGGVDTIVFHLVR
ncbi:MAG: hypothetical protein ACKV2T_25145 [Kofleriaceae bacterium]